MGRDGIRRAERKAAAHLLPWREKQARKSKTGSKEGALLWETQNTAFFNHLTAKAKTFQGACGSFTFSGEGNPGPKK